MQHSWNRKSIQHKWTLEKAKKVSMMEVMKMKIPERAELAYFLQNALKNRVASFERAKSYNHPYAYEKLQKEFKELNTITGYNFNFNAPVIQTRGKTRMLGPEYARIDQPAPKLLSYINQLQDFFKAKSSTVSGWKEVIRNESMKLFGYKEYNTKRGPRIVLNHFMSEEERENFWKLWSELKASGKVAIGYYTSESMKETGFTRIWREKLDNNEWTYGDLTGMLNTMLAAMKSSGVPVSDIEEHKPGDVSDPTAPDPGDGVASNVFEW